MAKGLYTCKVAINTYPCLVFNIDTEECILLNTSKKKQKTATAKSVGEGPGEGFFTEERRPKRYELFPWFRHFLGKNSCMRIGSSSEWWLLLLLYLRYSK